MSLLSNSQVWVWEEEPADRDFVELLEGEKINPLLQVPTTSLSGTHQHRCSTCTLNVVEQKKRWWSQCPIFVSSSNPLSTVMPCGSVSTPSVTLCTDTEFRWHSPWLKELRRKKMASPYLVRTHVLFPWLEQTVLDVATTKFTILVEGIHKFYQKLKEILEPKSIDTLFAFELGMCHEDMWRPVYDARAVRVIPGSAICSLFTSISWTYYATLFRRMVSQCGSFQILIEIGR